MASSIAEQFKTFLSKVWEECPDKDMDPRPRYASAVAQTLIEFVEFSEKIFRGLGARLKTIEEQLASIQQHIGQPANGHAGEGNGQTPEAAAPAPQRRGGRPGAGMVRLDAMGVPMSPEDQAEEEKADMQLNGAIDETRYVPRDRVPPLQPSVQAGPAGAPAGQSTPSNQS